MTCSSLCAIVRERVPRRPLNCLLNVRITTSFPVQGPREAEIGV